MVPPFDSYSTGVISYREALQRYDPGESPNFISLEGYVVARIMVEAMERSGRHLTTESLIDSLETIRDWDLGIGTSISFSLSDHQASHRVWGTTINGEGGFDPVTLNSDVGRASSAESIP